MNIWSSRGVVGGVGRGRTCLVRLCLRHVWEGVTLSVAREVSTGSGLRLRGMASWVGLE